VSYRRNISTPLRGVDQKIRTPSLNTCRCMQQVREGFSLSSGRAQSVGLMILM